MSTKRKSAAKSIPKAAAKKQKTDGNGDDTVLPLGKWRVVLTGEFKNKTSLERALKEKGVAITGSVSGKTTHLVLGKSGTNEYGKPTGVGSKKYSEAKRRSLSGQGRGREEGGGETSEECENKEQGAVCF